MNRLLLLVCLCFLVFLNVANAQSNGDYRTTGTASFSTATNWEVFNGSWGAATNPPATPAAAVTTQTTQTSFNLTTTGTGGGTTAPNTATVNGAVSASLTFVISTPVTGSVPVAGQPITGTGIGTNNYITAYNAGSRQVTVNVAVTLANGVTVSYGSQLTNNRTIELTNTTAGIPAVGMPISGTGIASSSYVTAVNVGGNANCITISAAPTSTRTGNTINFLGIGASPNYNVYLAATNAGILVGQRVTGTGINGGTTVAAISGRALTLSQPAYTAGSNVTLTFYTAATIPNMYINHTTSIDVTAVPNITRLFINDASSTNAGTGAVYSNNNSGFSVSSVVALTVGDVTVATGSTFSIIGGSARHTLTFTGTGTIINNLGGIDFYTNNSKNVGLYIASSGSSTISSSASLRLFDITVVSGSSLVLPSSSISVASSITNNGSGITTAAGGTIVFNNGSSTVQTGTIGFNNVTINTGATFAQSAVIMNIAGNVVCNGTITGSSTTTNFTGTTAITGTPTAISFNTIAIASSSSLTAHSGNMNITGSYSNSGTFTHNSGTLTFTGTSSTLTLAGSMTGSNAFSKLIFNGSGATWTFNAAADVASDFTITLGTVRGFASGNVSIAGNFVNNGTFTHNSGTIYFNGTTALSGSSAFTFNNVIIASGASLTPAASSTITLVNNWTNSGGTFTANSSTVLLSPTAAAQAISGNTTFFSLTKNATVASTLTLTSGSTQTITGTLTFSGASNAAILTIRSSASPSQAIITPTAVSGMSFLKVTDINNTASTITTASSSSGGNNLNWSFPNNTWTGTTSTSWNLATNWSLGIIPTTGDNVVIASTVNQPTTDVAVTITNLTINDGATLTLGGFAFTVSGTTTIGAGASGILTMSSGTGTKTFTGLVTVNANGSFSTANQSVTVNFAGGITNNGTFNSSGISTGTFNFTANQDLNGAGTLATTIYFNTTALSTGVTINNYTSFSSGAALSAGGASCSWVQQANSTFYYGSSTLPASNFTLVASTNTPNTVNYNRNNNQTVFATNYSNLTLSSSPTKTLSANLIVTGNLFIDNGATLNTTSAYSVSVTGTTTVGGGTSGTFTVATSSGTNTFTGLVTVANGGTWNNSTGNFPITFQGGISNSGTFTAGSGVHTFSTNAQALSGTLSLPSVTVTAITLTNNGNLTITTALDGTGTFAQGNSSTVNLGMSAVPAVAAITASASGNTVNYNRSGSQIIFGCDYRNLTLSGTSGKTFSLLGTANITGNLTLSGTASVSSTGIPLAVGGDFVIGDGTSFSVNNNTFTVGGNTFIGNSNGSGTSGTLSYSSSTGTRTFTGNVTIYAGGTWNNSSRTHSPTVGGDLTNNGTLILGTSGTYSIGGNFTNNGTFTANGATVSMTSTSTGKSISGSLTGSSAFFSLTFNGVGGAWTMPTNVDVTGTFTITNGTVTAPSSNLNLTVNFANSGTFTHNNGTVTFLGTTQSISGTSTTQFYNVTTANTTAVTVAANGTVSNNLTIANGTTFSIGAFTFTVSGTTTVGTTSGAASSLIINSSTGTKTFTGNVTLANNATFSITNNPVIIFGGDLTNNGIFLAGNTSAHAISIAGNYTQVGSFTAGIGTFTFNSTSTGKTITGTFTGTPGSYNLTGGFNNIVFNGVGGAWTLPNNVDLGGTFTVTNGAVTAGSGTINVTGSFSNAGTFTSTSGTMNLASHFTNSGTYNHSNGTVNFTGTNRFITSTTGSTTTNFYNLSTSGTATISAGTSTFNVQGDLSIGDGTSFTVSNSFINVTGTTNVGAGTSGSLIISSSTGTKVFAGDFNINAGATLNLSGSGSAISVQGNYTLAATGIMTGVSTSIITFSATTTKTITGTFTGTNAFNNLTFNGVGGNWALPTNVDVNSAFNLAAGTLTAPSGTLKVGGAFTSVSTAVFTHNGGTVQFTGSTNFGNSTCTFKNIIINSAVPVTIGSGSSISYAGDISNSGSLSNTGSSTFNGTSVLSGAGTFSLNTTTVNASCSLTSTSGSNVTFNGSFTNNGTFIHNNGTITLAGTSNFSTLSGNLTSATNGGFYKLIFNTTGTWRVNGNTDVSSDVTITSGTFAPGALGVFTVNIGGSFANTGTFTGGSSTINFNGSSTQTIGAATFNNLTINNTAGVSLTGNVSVAGVITLTNGVVTTSSNTLTLTNNTSATAAISGTPSSSKYINGNLIRTVSNAFSGYVFPVGQNVSGTDYYYPLTLSNISGTTNVSVAAFNGSSGGAADNTTLSDISTNEYWQVAATSSITAKISVTTAMIGIYEVIGTSVGTVPSGTYSSIGGSLDLGTNSILVSSSTSIPATGNYAYFVVATSSLPAPTITSFSSDFPSSSSYYSGSVLTITGTNFGATTSVVIGGASATVSAFTSTQLTVTVPTGVSGNAIAVSNSGGSDNTTGTYLTGILSAQAGDWSTASTWFTNAVPGSASTVIIRHAVTLNTTPSSPANLTVTSAGSLTLGTTNTSVITVTSSVTNNGTISLGTVLRSGQFTCGGTFTNSGTFNVGSTVASGLNQFGYLTLNGTSTNSGTILIDNGSISSTLIVGGALTNNSTITANSIVQLNSGGSIAGNGIVYATNSNLYYNSGSAVSVGSGAEWKTGTSSSAIGDAGIPYNVQVGRSQTGTLNSNTSLTIGSYMKALGTVTTNSTYTITVNNGAVLNTGKIANSGTLNVGTADIASMAIFGNAANATAISGSLSSMNNAGVLNIYGYFQYPLNAITTATGTVNVRPNAVYECGGSAPNFVNTGATYAASSYLYLSSPTNITSFNISDNATTPTFGNVIINSVAQTSNVSTQNLANVAGTLYIMNTNTGSFRNSATNLSLGGLQVGGSLSFNGSVITASAATFALASTTGLATQVNGDINIGSNGTLTTVSATTVSLTGNWINSGTFSSTSVNVAFNGASNQNIGTTTFPANLTINNAAGVTATAAVSVASTLTLTSGTLTPSGTFTIRGGTSVTSGNIDASAATVVYNGTSSQTIPAGTYVGNVQNLTINNTTGVAIGGTLNVTGVLTPTAGTLTTGGFLVMKSTSTNTARIAERSGSSPYISGDVTVERYIPSKSARYFSFLTSPVTQTVFNGWQQQMYVTGAGTGGQTCGSTSSNGGATDKYNSNWFDKTNRDIPSMHTYNATPVNGSRWVSIANTNATNLAPGKGFRVNVRGDRTQGTCADQLNGTSPSAPTEVTLIAKGTVGQGSTIIALNSISNTLLSLVGNPYPSPIDFATLYTNNLGSIYNNTWALSPSASGNYTSYNNGVTSNAPSGYSDGLGNTSFIASGQAFFVQAKSAASGGTGSITFTEGTKTTGVIPNTSFFGTANNQLFRVTMTANDNSKLDEAVVRFNSNGSSAYNPNWDALSLSAGSQTLASLKAATKLAIATRPDSLLVDTVKLSLSSVSADNFRLVFSDYQGIDSTKAIVLRDKYLGVSHDVRANQVYNFNVTADTASKGSNRFEIVFTKGGNPLPVNFVNVRAAKADRGVAVSWKVAQPINIAKYNVQRSIDGVNFTSIATTKATASNDYAVTDNQLPDATIVYYRIQSVELNGTKGYSQIALVNLNSKAEVVSIYPNPVKEVMNVTINSVENVAYTFRIVNLAGKEVIRKSEITSKQFSMNVSNLAVGVYMVEFTNAKGEKSMVKMIKE